MWSNNVIAYYVYLDINRLLILKFLIFLSMRISFYAITQIVLTEIPMIVKCGLICKQYFLKKERIML